MEEIIQISTNTNADWYKNGVQDNYVKVMETNDVSKTQ